MHPFWAVRRMTETQLARERSERQVASPGQLLPRFSCELEMRSLSNVSIATAGGQALNRSRLFEVPFLKNSRPLEEGEELILEVFEKTKDARTAKRTWRDVMKDDERSAKGRNNDKGQKK